MPETEAGQRLRLIVLIASLSAFGPLTTDVYLPGLPDISRDLSTSTSGAQLTLTGYVLGLALGQVAMGPLSDAMGRRAPLLAGLILFVVASIGCVLAPSIVTLDLLRVVQGAAGGGGIVIARAIVRDRYRGAEAARVYSAITAMISITPAGLRGRTGRTSSACSR